MKAQGDEHWVDEAGESPRCRRVQSPVAGNRRADAAVSVVALRLMGLVGGAMVRWEKP